jgi:hypothetical protein
MMAASTSQLAEQNVRVIVMAFSQVAAIISPSRRSALGASLRHRYGSSFISAPMPTIPSMINTSSPITIQPCKAVMFSAKDCDEYRQAAGAVAKSIAPNQHATTMLFPHSSAMLVRESR